VELRGAAQAELGWGGLSATVDSGGSVLQSMDDKEGIGIADITLDPRRKTTASKVCTGIGIAERAVGGSAGAAAVADECSRAQTSMRPTPSARQRRVPTEPPVFVMSVLANQEVGRRNRTRAGRHNGVESTSAATTECGPEVFVKRRGPQPLAGPIPFSLR
jgi:hypothetical protein